MAERRAPGEDLCDPDVLADDVPGRLDAVTAHVQERAAAGRLGVPEVLRMRPGVALTRAHREDPPERARRDHLGDLDDLRAEDFVLHVAVEDARVLDEAEHLGGLRAFRPSGLVHRTPLPAAAAARTASRWRWLGGRRRPGHLGVAAQAGHRVVVRAMPWEVAKAAARVAAGPGVRHGPGARHVPEATGSGPR